MRRLPASGEPPMIAEAASSSHDEFNCSVSPNRMRGMTRVM